MHRRIRAQLALKVAAGSTRCARCGRTIRAGEPWDLGHVDGQRYQYAGPEHRACNRATALHRALRSERRTSRDW